MLLFAPAEDWNETNHTTAWTAWSYCAVYTLLLVKREVHQMRIGLRDYLVDYWNYLDLLQQGLSMAALVAMASRDVDTTLTTRPQWLPSWWSCGSKSCNEYVGMVQAMALLCGWLKALYFMRGFKSTAFVINMLTQIFQDMIIFLVVLVFIFIA